MILVFKLNTKNLQYKTKPDLQQQSDDKRMLPVKFENNRIYPDKFGYFFVY